MKGFKEIWSRWKAWLAKDTLSEEDLCARRSGRQISQPSGRMPESMEGSRHDRGGTKTGGRSRNFFVLEKMESEEKKEEKIEEKQNRNHSFLLLKCRHM